MSNDYFDLAAVKEVQLAYNERRAALHQAPRSWSTNKWVDGSSDPAVGADGHHVDFFSEIQGWITANCQYWMPPTTTDYDSTNKADFKTIGELASAASVSAWRYMCEHYLAGSFFISSSFYGWLRITDSGSTYGTAQDGDYLHFETSSSHYDIYEQMLTALSALKITKLSGGSSYGSTLAQRTTGTPRGYLRNGTDSGVKTAADAAYDADTPGTESGTAPYASFAAQEPAGTYGWFEHSQSGVVQYYLYSAGVGSMYSLVSAIKVYLETEAYAAGGGYSDFNTGLVENKLAEVAGSISPTADGTSYTAALAQVLNGSDFSGFGLPAGGFQATSDPWRGIVVWNFTNAD